MLAALAVVAWVAVLLPSSGGTDVAGADQVVLDGVGVEAVPAPPGGWYPLAVNNRGQVLTSAFPPGFMISWDVSDPIARDVPAPGYTPFVWTLGENGLAVGGYLPAGEFVTHSAAVDLATGAQFILDSGTGTAVADLQNANGMIAGTGSEIVGGLAVPVAWLALDAPIAYAPIPGTAEGLTDSGQVLITDSNGFGHIWDVAAGTVRSLDELGGAFAMTMNSSGRVVAQEPDGSAVALDLSTGAVARAEGRPVGRVSEQGRVLLESGDSNSVFSWSPDDGSVLPVDPYAGEEGIYRTFTTAMNGRGQVAGVTEFVDGSRRAFVWDPVAHAVTLATSPPGGVWLNPTALNDVGVVVGNFQGPMAALGPWQATFRTSPDAPVDLVGVPAAMAVRLDWAPPNVEGDAPISGYVVRRDGEEIGRVDPDVLTWTGQVDTTDPYSYTVSAVNAYGESAPSLPVELAAEPGPSATVVVVRPAFTG